MSKEECTPLCDFCKFYNFNPDKEGAYIGLGYCTKHKKASAPEHDCDDFECEQCDTLKGMKGEK